MWRINTVSPMDAWDAFWYGIIQGLTEFLPVSSSGHLAIAHRWGLGAGLARESELAFDVLLHGASFIAILIAFAPKIICLLPWSQRRSWLLLACMSFPAGLVGYGMQDYVAMAGGSWWLLAGTYTATCAWLLLAHKRNVMVPNNANSEQSGDAAVDRWSELSIKRALAIGVAQIPALLPGISRSGSSLGAGLLLGLERKFAVECAFLAGLPLIGGAVIFKATSGDYGNLVTEIGWTAILAGTITALVSGLVAIWLLTLVTRKGQLGWFAWYCGLLAIVSLIMALAGDPAH